MINEEVMLYDLKLLATKFYKIIEVNLNEDTYFEVKVDDDEPHVYTGLQKWIDAFIAGGGVRESDIPVFKNFFDPLILKEKVGEEWQRVYYKRKIGDEYRMVCMEVIPYENFSKEDAIVIIVVRDVEDYIKDWKEQQEK